MGEIFTLDQMFVLPLNSQLNFDLICLGLYPARIERTKDADELVSDEKSP
jgi:hypothetical protein